MFQPARYFFLPDIARHSGWQFLLDIVRRSRVGLTMDLSASSAKLHFALKSLRLRWSQTKADWNDIVRQDFEQNHLGPLEAQLSAALGAMTRLDQVLARAQQECM